MLVPGSQPISYCSSKNMLVCQLCLFHMFVLTVLIWYCIMLRLRPSTLSFVMIRNLYLLLNHCEALEDCGGHLRVIRPLHMYFLLKCRSVHFRAGLCSAASCILLIMSYGGLDVWIGGCCFLECLCPTFGAPKRRKTPSPPISKASVAIWAMPAICWAKRPIGGGGYCSASMVVICGYASSRNSLSCR